MGIKHNDKQTKKDAKPLLKGGLKCVKIVNVDVIVHSYKAWVQIPKSIMWAIKIDIKIIKWLLSKIGVK